MDKGHYPSVQKGSPHLIVIAVLSIIPLDENERRTSDGSVRFHLFVRMCVCAQVNDKLSICDEASITEVAHIVTHARMDLHVNVQVAFLCERSSTNIALIGFLPLMQRILITLI